MKGYILGAFCCSFLIVGNCVLMSAPDCPIIGSKELEAFQDALHEAQPTYVEGRTERSFKYKGGDWYMDPGSWTRFQDFFSDLKAIEPEGEDKLKNRCHYKQIRTRSKGKHGEVKFSYPFDMTYRGE